MSDDWLKREFDEHPGMEVRLTIGIHRGTMMSRDSEQPKFVTSMDEARAEVAKAEREYASFGYYIWFAEARERDGKSTKLHRGVQYR